MGGARGWLGGMMGFGVEQPWSNVEIGQVYTYFDAVADAAIINIAPTRIASQST